MATIQELVTRFKADITDFDTKVKTVQAEMRKTGTYADMTAKEFDNLSKKVAKSLQDQEKAILKANEKATKSLFDLQISARDAGVAIGATAVAISAFSIAVGSQMEGAEVRIRSFLGSAEASHQSIAFLRDTADDTGASILGLSDNFAKMTVFVDGGIVSLQEAQELTKGLSQTAIALGADTARLNDVIYGLTQTLGAGVVRAEEFNQVTEPLPGLINKMEEATGLASGELRKMVNEGLITSEMFKKILIPAMKDFEGQSDAMSDTLMSNYGSMKNTFVALGEDIYDNINTPLAMAIDLMNTLAKGQVSTKRATTEELNRRLEGSQELAKQEQARKRFQLFDLSPITNFLGLSTDFEGNNKEILNELGNRGEFIDFDKKFKEDAKALEVPIKPKIMVDDSTLKQIQELRDKLGDGGGAKKGVRASGVGNASPTIPKQTESEKEAERLAEIRQNAIASAKETIAVAQAEMKTFEDLAHVKKTTAELYKLEAVGIEKNSKAYKGLSVQLADTFKQQQMMQEAIDLKEFIKDKQNENQALADQAKFVGMTRLEIEQYNIARALQIDLDSKKKEMTPEGYGAYSRQATDFANEQAMILEQNQAYMESMQGGIDAIMTEMRENALMDADIIQGAYQSMTGNLAQMLEEATESGKLNFADMTQAILQDINRMIIRYIAMQAIMGVVNAVAGAYVGGAGSEVTTGTATANDFGVNLGGGTSGFVAPRASGGNVVGGVPYLVGEAGPEIFMPNKTGMIVPNDKIGGSNNVFNFYNNVDARGADPSSASQIRYALEKNKRETIMEVESRMRSNGSMSKTIRSLS